MQDNGKKASRLADTKIKFREDLRCSLHEQGGQPRYVVEDPVGSKFFRLGVHEWTFVSFLDGKRTVREAYDLAVESVGPNQLPHAEVSRLCRWLLRSGLARIVEAERASEEVFGPKVEPNREAWNPFSIRLPLFNPDQLLATLLPWMGWLFSRQVFYIWLCACFAGGYQIVLQWDQFATASTELLSPDSWLLLIAIWLVLKVIHEFAHGLACKKFGGSVSRAGIILILFSPIAYVDLTSSWRIRSKWKRVFISASGMYAEFGVAAVAAIVWGNSQPGLLNHLAHKTVLMAGLTTLLFNVNPLMRFDGYYILADLLDITNLYQRGQVWTRYWGQRFLLGVEVKSPEPHEKVGTLIKCYGLGTWIWRVLICCTLIVASASLLHGLGLILSFVGVLLWIYMPVVRLAKYLVHGNSAGEPKPRNVAIRVSAATFVLALALMLPWPGSVAAPAVVQYDPLTVVRAGIAGFVREVCVTGGELVSTGQVLASLSNEEESLQLADLELQIQQSTLKTREMRKSGDIAKYQVELNNRKTLETKANELRERLAGLRVKAPVSGRIIGRNLETMIGQYVAAGDQLLAIGVEASKQLEASIAQEDVDRFQAQVGSRVRARVRGRGMVAPGTKLAGLGPAASRRLSHPALGAQNGGPLAMTEVAPDPEMPGDDTASLELVAPRLDAKISLPPEIAADLRAGELATVSLGRSRGTVGACLYEWLSSWLREKTTQSAGD